MLTVILLTYNHEATLGKALDSILVQETSHSYRIWICEDHSTDDTLRVCTEYATRYPDRITLIAQPINTRGRHLREALCRIDTKYFALLEGDDYWCDKQKIQIGVDTLEQNAEYTTFAHDTWFDDAQAKTRKSLVHDIHKTDIRNPLDLQTAPYLHTSSRIHRSVVDFRRFPKGMMVYDIYLFYLFLDKGALYYADRIMSVYNITGTGMWSQLTVEQRRRNTELAFFAINWLLDYKYDAFFSTKIAGRTFKHLKRCFGMKLGWHLYVLAKYRSLTL